MKSLKDHFTDSLRNIRHQLLSVESRSDSPDEAPESIQNLNLKELLQNLIEMLVEKVKATLLDLSVSNNFSVFRFKKNLILKIINYFLVLCER